MLIVINAAFKRYKFPIFYSNHLFSISVWGSTECFLTSKGRLCLPVVITEAQSYLFMHCWHLAVLHIVGHLPRPDPLGWRKISVWTTKVTIFSRQAAKQCSFLTSIPFFSYCVTVNRVILTWGIYFTSDGPDLQSLDPHFPSNWGSWTLGQAFPVSPLSSPRSHHRFLICCISYKWVHSSTFIDRDTLHISQELKSSGPGKHKVYWGWHVRIPTLDAISRWSRTHESAEDGKSHSK